MFKHCAGCDLVHLWTEFSPDRHKASGLSVYCLGCQRRRHNTRYRRTAGAASKRYYRAHRARILAKRAARGV